MIWWYCLVPPPVDNVVWHPGQQLFQPLNLTLENISLDSCFQETTSAYAFLFKWIWIFTRYSFQYVEFCTPDNFSIIIPIKCKTFLSNDADIVNKKKWFLSRNQMFLKASITKKIGPLSLISCSLKISGHRNKSSCTEPQISGPFPSSS